MKVWCGGRVMPRFGVGVGSCLTLPSTLALTNPTRAHKAPVNAHLVSCTLLLYEGGELESSETFPSSSSTMIEASVPEVCLATVRVSVSHAAGSATSGRPRGRKVAGALLSGWYNVRSATRNLARGPRRQGEGAELSHSTAALFTALTGFASSSPVPLHPLAPSGLPISHSLSSVLRDFLTWMNSATNTCWYASSGKFGSASITTLSDPLRVARGSAPRDGPLNVRKGSTGRKACASAGSRSVTHERRRGLATKRRMELTLGRPLGA